MPRTLDEWTLPESDASLALRAFTHELRAESPSQAMESACKGLRQRVCSAGWASDLPSFVRAFGCQVLESPIPTAGRLDISGDRYVIRVRRGDGISGRSGRGDPRPPSILD